MSRKDVARHAPDVAKVVSCYGHEAVSWETHDSYYQSGTVIRVKTRSGDLMVKPFRTDSSRLPNWVNCVEALNENHYRYMPHFLYTDKGRPYAGVNGHVFYVTDWVEGRTLPDTPSALYALGMALASLHSCTVPLRERMEESALVRRIRRYKTSAATARGWDWSPADGDIEKRQWLWEHQQTFHDMAEEAWSWLDGAEGREVSEIEKLTPPLVHGDITRFNVLVTGRSDLRLIDWDGLALGSAWVELANALSNTALFKPTLMEALLSGYTRIRSISQSERTVVAALFRLPREAWYARRTIGGSTHWNDELLTVLQTTWTDRLAAVRWMDQWAGTGRRGEG